MKFLNIKTSHIEWRLDKHFFQTMVGAISDKFTNSANFGI